MSVVLLLAFAVALPLAAQTDSDRSWARLVEGNGRFAAATNLTFLDVINRRDDDQEPEVSIISCSDSRVSPEIIFHQNLLDIFVSRTAGNVADKFALASLEYAATPPRLWTNLIVVVGHSHCGAIEAALKPGMPGTPNLNALVTQIRTSITPNRYPNPTAAQIAVAAKANAKGVANYLTAHSTVLRDAVRSGKIRIVAAYHDLSTGAVTVVP
jgi:carbonic anhydrase